MSTYNEKVKEIRLKRGLTQQEVGEKMGLKRNTISNWEAGIRTMNVNQLIEFADLMDVSLEFFHTNSTEDVSHAVSDIETFFKSDSVTEKEKDMVFCNLMMFYMKSKYKD